MAIQIKVDENAYQGKEIVINGIVLNFTIAYNTSDDVNNDGYGAWYFDIQDRKFNDIISGVKVLPIQNLTSRYLSLNTLLDGDIWCMNNKDKTADINRSNFGTDKKFQLMYFSNEEMVSEGLK